MIRSLITRLACRRHGHRWTFAAEPPFCLNCKRTGWAA